MQVSGFGNFPLSSLPLHSSHERQSKKTGSVETDVPAIKYKKRCGEEEKSELQYGKNGIISLSSVLKDREGSEDKLVRDMSAWLLPEFSSANAISY